MKDVERMISRLSILDNNIKLNDENVYELLLEKDGLINDLYLFYGMVIKA